MRKPIIRHSFNEETLVEHIRATQGIQQTAFIYLTFENSPFNFVLIYETACTNQSHVLVAENDIPVVQNVVTNESEKKLSNFNSLLLPQCEDEEVKKEISSSQKDEEESFTTVLEDSYKNHIVRSIGKK